MKLTIIIPVYKVEAYLDFCLKKHSTAKRGGLRSHPRGRWFAGQKRSAL